MAFITTEELQDYLASFVVERVRVYLPEIRRVQTVVGVVNDVGELLETRHETKEVASVEAACRNFPARKYLRARRIREFRIAFLRRQFAIVPDGSPVALLCTKVPFTDGYEVEELSSAAIVARFHAY